MLHDIDSFGQELNALGELPGRVPQVGGTVFWTHLVDWVLWWLGYALGAFALCDRRPQALRPLFQARAVDRFGPGRPLVESTPGNSGHEVGTAVMATVDDGQQWFAPAFESLLRDLEASELLRESYPEFVTPDDEPKRSLVDFDFVLSVALGIAQHRAIAHWTMYSQISAEFARRLYGDARMRTMVADAMGLSLEEFDQQAPGALDAAHALGQYGGDRSAVAALQTGRL